jgi:hypothetical protein
MTRIPLAVALALLAAPASAAADGLPVLGVDVGRTGVVGEDHRYVTLGAPRGTLVARITRDGGVVTDTRLLPERLTIPAVAYDDSAGGLSADGRTLVLIRPRHTFPQRSTRMRLLDTRELKARRAITLRGDYSFDAISPDGRRLFLIHYTSRRDYTRYDVLSYDVVTRRLNRKPIVDPHEPGEEMRGSPLSRSTSPDGRWAYTLYDGAGGHPFVHALDTVGVTARCIDLHALEGRDDLRALGLATSPDGRRVTVMRGSRPLQVIDARTFEVGEPAVPARREVAPAAEGGFPLWPVLVLAAVALAAGALGLRRWTRPPRSPSTAARPARRSAKSPAPR